MTLNILLGIVGMFQQMIIILVTIPVFVIIPVILCVWRAEKLKMNKVLGGVLGFIFSYVAVLIMYLLPKR
jgi:hypothetical protein